MIDNGIQSGTRALLSQRSKKLLTLTLHCLRELRVIVNLISYFQFNHLFSSPVVLYLDFHLVTTCLFPPIQSRIGYGCPRRSVQSTSF